MTKEKAPAYQRYAKQILGDDIVLAMDWDAVGMHNWLLDISWQQTPPGTIPDDQAVLRRWLRLPPNAVLCASSDPYCRCNDHVWRRVWPQISPAWPILESGRRGNHGMMRTAERKANYSRGNSEPKGIVRTQTATQIDTQIARKYVRKFGEEEEEYIKDSSSTDSIKPKDSTNLKYARDDLDFDVLLQIGLDAQKILPYKTGDSSAARLYAGIIEQQIREYGREPQEIIQAMLLAWQEYSALPPPSSGFRWPPKAFYEQGIWQRREVWKETNGRLQSAFEKRSKATSDEVERRLRERFGSAQVTGD